MKTSKQRTISVITPTYNRQNLINNAIDSILAQSFEDFEMIIVDDGSTDSTKSLVAKYMSNDPRIRYFLKENGGPSAARNFGIEQAVGKWILYLDSDDTLFPNCLETMMKYIGDETVFAFPRSDRSLELYENGQLAQVIDDSSDTPERFTIEDIFNRNAGFSPNGFMHLKSIINSELCWDPDLAFMEDWDLMLSIGEKYPNGFTYVPIVLQKYTQKFGSDNLCSNATYSDWANAFEYIYRKHKNNKTLKNQTWYPAKLRKWQNFQDEFDAGLRGPYTHHYFQS